MAMIGTWASSAVGAEFESLHEGLTVDLIATHRDRLKTCELGADVESVLKANSNGYDYLPVIDISASGVEHIVGLLSTKTLVAPPTSGQTVASIYQPLSEAFIIGADSSILQFIIGAESRPCRLVVSGAHIVGLVSLSDLQKLPVRAALFALITDFEITMMEIIRKCYADDGEWMGQLNDNRRKKVKRQRDLSAEADGWVDSLLFTQFCDKRDLILHKYCGILSRARLESQLKRIEALRNCVAHANDYAASPERAVDVCALVKEMPALRQDLIENTAP